MLTAAHSATSDSRPPYGPFAAPPSGLGDDLTGSPSLRDASPRSSDGSPARSATATTWKVVYAIVERGARKHWLRIGMAFVNRDGSLNVRLDAVPLSGQLHIRDNPRATSARTARTSASPAAAARAAPCRSSANLPRRARSRAAASSPVGAPGTPPSGSVRPARSTIGPITVGRPGTCRRTSSYPPFLRKNHKKRRTDHATHHEKVSSLLTALACLMLGLATGSPAAAAPPANPASRLPPRQPRSRPSRQQRSDGKRNRRGQHQRRQQRTAAPPRRRTQPRRGHRQLPQEPPFKRVDELTRIKGIGRKSLLRLRPS